VHLTPGELTILGSAFTLAGVALGALLGRGQARGERLAAARTELYEQVLRAANAMQDDRRKMPPWGNRTDEQVIEQLRARLQVLGHVKVITAWLTLSIAQADWWLATIKIHKGSQSPETHQQRVSMEEEATRRTRELEAAIRRQVIGRRQV
jgi:hypothetical protein